MFIYYVIIIVWFILELICFLQKNKYSSERIKLIQKKSTKFIFLLLFLTCAFRAYDVQHYIGIDTNGYYYSYVQHSHYYLLANEIIENVKGDVGYYLLEYYLGNMNLDFYVLLIVEALVYIGSMYIFIKQYSKDPLLSTLFFICLLFTFSLSTIRQSMAMGICLLAYMLYDKYKEKKLKGIIIYGLLVMLAMTFHRSAIIFVPAILVAKIKYNKKIIFIFLAIAALTMIFKAQFSRLFISLGGDYYEKYESYSITGDNVGTKFYVFILFFVLLNIIFSKKLNIDSNSDSFIYMILTMLIIFPAVQSGGAMMRIYYYYYMFAPVYMANTLNCITDKNLRLLVRLLIIAFLVYLFLNGNFVANRLAPYYFSFGNFN